MAKDIATAREGAVVLGLGSVDVRKVESLQSAVEKCVNELGGIDFVIAGAAGNFLAPIRSLSPNAFKSVIDIDVLGSYNTAKLTLQYLVESAAKHKVNGQRCKALSYVLYSPCRLTAAELRAPALAVVSFLSALPTSRLVCPCRLMW